MVGTPARLPTQLVIGRPLPFMADDLDRAAMLTDADIVAAQAFWWTLAPARFIHLLDAMEAIYGR